MAFELPDGKIARNIQEQVAFLTEKLKDLYAAFNQSGLKKIVIVEELPETGDPNILYLLAMEDPEENNYYDEYLWLDDQWELIGSTQIDLSDYCTLSTDQTITGSKLIKVGEDSYIKFESTSDAGNYSEIGRRGGYTTIRHNGSNKILIGGSVNYSYSNFIPGSGSNLDLGSNSMNWKSLYLSDSIYLTSNWQIHESSNGILYLENSGQGTGIRFERDKLFPYTNNYTSLGNSSFRFKDLYLSGVIDFGDNAKIQKDSSNRINILNNGNVKIKVGANETYFANHVEPDSNNTYTLGRSGVKWNIVYCRYLNDDNVNVSVSDLAAKTHLYNHLIALSDSTSLVVVSSRSTAYDSLAPSMFNDSVDFKIFGGGKVLTYLGGTVMTTLFYIDPLGVSITSKSLTGLTITSDIISDY